MSDDSDKFFMTQLFVFKTKELLDKLSKHLGPFTKIQKVPAYCKVWRIGVRSPDFKPQPTELVHIIDIEIIHFFGMHIGYNEEVDTLVYWTEEQEW
jgi:hypothetical protein